MKQKWWMVNSVQDKFTNVAAMAHQYLGCPASSTAVERLFSYVGIAYSDKRKSAEPETIKKLMFARANLP